MPNFVAFKHVIFSFYRTKSHHTVQTMECHESTSDYKEESNDSVDVLMQESNSGFDEVNSCGKNVTPLTEGTKTGCALMTDAELGMKIERCHSYFYKFFVQTIGVSENVQEIGRYLIVPVVGYICVLFKINKIFYLCTCMWQTM
jgi:hypothetical protein